MKQPTPGRRYRSALSDMDDNGVLTVCAITGEKLIIEQGINQILSLKRAVDRYVANYEAEEIKSA